MDAEPPTEESSSGPTTSKIVFVMWGLGSLTVLILVAFGISLFATVGARAKAEFDVQSLSSAIDEYKAHMGVLPARLGGGISMRDSLARLAALMAFCALSLFSAAAHSADTGLITVASKHSVPETVRRFEDAVRAKGWKFFTEIDHAAAAREVGLELKPRTVIIFGFPKGGTGPMQKAATLAIDNPPKALVWQDDQDKVWLTYNSAEYHLLTIYPRHGLPAPPAEMVKAYTQLLAELSRLATE